MHELETSNFDKTTHRIWWAMNLYRGKNIIPTFSWNFVVKSNFYENLLPYSSVHFVLCFITCTDDSNNKSVIGSGAKMFIFVRAITYGQVLKCKMFFIGIGLNDCSLAWFYRLWILSVVIINFCSTMIYRFLFLYFSAFNFLSKSMWKY